MTRTERTLKYISERQDGRDEVDIFRRLSKISFTEMRSFLQNLMKQGLISSYGRRVEGSRVTTFWQITAKGRQLVGGYEHAAQKQSASCNCG